MSSAKLAAACALAAVSLSGCGVASKPEAGSRQAATTSTKQATDPRLKHVKCLKADHIHYRLETLHGYPSIQVGSKPSGPTIEFTATSGAAQDTAIKGQAQGAEVIGAALVYPKLASDPLMTKVEACMASGVSG
jgi:hypothetical protein